MRYQVIGVQELHVQHAAATHLVSMAASAGYCMMFSVPADAATTTAGVAILVDSSLLRRGEALLHDTAVHCHSTGRLLVVPMDWGGHKLLLTNCYVPNQAVAARAYLLDVLRPVLEGAAGRQAVLLGDWNFVLDVSLDRVRSQAAAGGADAAALRRTHSDTACTEVFQSMTAHMTDVFRHKCPQSRGLTFFGVHGGARLDRIYVPDVLIPLVCTARIATVDGSFSDHRAMCMQLLPTPAAVTVPRTLTQPRTRRPRVRLVFWGCGVLRLQFAQWLQAQLACAPADDCDLLLWWPRFKVHLVAEVAALNRQRRQQSDPPPQVHDRRLAAKKAMDVAMAEFEQGDTSALPRVLAHRREWAAALATAQQHARVHGLPVEWLPANERPSPAFTAALSPPKRVQMAAAIRNPSNGRLVPPGVGQADIMARHYASISAGGARDPLAEQAVLDALPEHGRTGVPPDVEAQLGDDVVDEREVALALRRSPSGKAPGWDGIPVEVYRKCSTVMLPVLARLFTAIGRTRCTPRDFTKGLIVSLHKGGDDMASPQQYRPITLLNADYRLLAKVLTNRLLPVAGQLISAEQSAFLPGRHIGEGIMLLQLLPHALAAARHAGAAVVFLDFAKAYDTVSRPFLLALLAAFGLGQGFGRWVTLLLANTKANAIMSGFTSRNVRFAAGVRQGCPLSPVLYLFVAEAMLRLLKAQPQLGLHVAGVRVVAQQFADDAKVFLRTDNDVDILLSTMDVFRRASGEALNIDKCAVLPIGPPRRAAPPAGSLIQGVPVKHIVTSHGFSFACHVGEARPTADWDCMLIRLHTKISTLAKMPLSMFGRATGAATYALSLIMYYAEFTDTLHAETVVELQRKVAHLVDRNLRYGFTYMRSDLLLGPAKLGGAGVLPIQQHIHARRAVWAIRLLLGDAATPWVAVGRFVLREAWGPSSPWHNMLPAMPDALANHPDVVAGRVAVAALLPGPLSWVFASLHRLPRLASLVLRGAMPPLDSAQCRDVPLLGNPYISCSLDVHPPVGTTANAPLPDLHVLAAMQVHTLGQLLQLSTTLSACADDHHWQRVSMGRVWGALLCQPGYVMLRCREGVEAVVTRVLSSIPPEWLQLASQTPFIVGGGTSHTVQAVAVELLNHLSWPAALQLPASPGVGATDQPRCPLPSLSVGLATSLMLQPVVDERHRRWGVFVMEAEGIADTPHMSPVQVAKMYALYKHLWRLGWHNDRKQVFWRLAVNALPFSSRFHRGISCVCGGLEAADPGRMHHFWECAAAQALVIVLTRTCGEGVAVGRRHLWLMVVPPALRARYGPAPWLQQVWRVVCLAALNAMWDVAQVVLRSPGQQHLTAALLCAKAVLQFRIYLEEFAAVGRPPRAWARLLPGDAPFLRAGAHGGLHVAVQWD